MPSCGRRTRLEHLERESAPCSTPGQSFDLQELRRRLTCRTARAEAAIKPGSRPVTNQIHPPVRRRPEFGWSCLAGV